MNQQQTEQRVVGVREIRTVTNSKRGKYIEGHAAVFYQYADIGGQFYEVIEPTAFNGCDLSDVALFINHNHKDIPLARTISGTLKVAVDDIGLAFSANLDVENNPNARELYSSIERGDIRGMSFSFYVDEDEWRDVNSEMPLRRIHKIKKVLEVSCATYPAYNATDVDVARAKDTLARAKKMTAESAAELHQLKLKITETGKSTTTEKETSKSMAPKATSTERTGYDWLAADKEFRDKSGVAKAVESPYNIFGDQRAIKVTNAPSSIVLPTISSKIVIPTFETPCTLVDAVRHLTLNGGDTFNQPYITSLAEGADYTDEGAPAIESDTFFGYAEIRRIKVTSYAELSEELEKLPAANYANVVFESVGTAIRKFLNREILFGEGSDEQKSHITGIFSERATAIDPDTDITISQISDTTLDTILEHYSGSEDISIGQSVLILSKADLIAFAKVRTSANQKFYDIKFDSDTSGTISGVRFILNSTCKSVSLSPAAGGAQSGEYIMAFGNPQNYELVEFNPLTVERSDSWHFRRDLTCYRGECYAGGNVIRRNGFLRIRRK